MCSADTSSSWNYLTLDVIGQFDTGSGSLQHEVNTAIYKYIQHETDYVKQRLALAQENVEKLESRLLFLENKYLRLQNITIALTQELEEAVENQLEWEETSQQKQLQLDRALEQYEISLDARTNISSICEVLDCQEVCKKGAKATTCYRPVYVTGNTTCYKFDYVPAKVTLSKHKLVKYCEWVDSCRPGWDIEWTFMIPIPIPLPLPTFRTKCSKVCRSTTRYETRFYEGYEPILQKVAFTCPIQQYNFTESYDCWKVYNCAIFMEEEPCATSNKNCEAMKKQMSISATQISDEALIELNVLFDEYREAVAKSAQFKNKVAIIMHEKALAEQKLNLTYYSSYRSTSAYHQMEENYDQIMATLKSSSSLVDWLDTTIPENLVYVNALDFSVSIAAESPVVFPVSIHYSLPYLGIAYTITVVIDFNAPFYLVVDRIVQEVLQNAFVNNVLSPVKRFIIKRQIPNVRPTDTATFFSNNCRALQHVERYLYYLQHSFELAKNNTLTSIENMKALIRLLEKDVSMTSNLSEYYQYDLSHRKIQYLNSTKTSYLQVISNIEADAVQQWHSNMDNYHNVVSSVGEFPCFTFTDCVYVMTDILARLLVDVPMAESAALLHQLPEIRENVTTFVTDTSIHLEEAEVELQSFVNFTRHVSSLNYWCSSVPVIITHPSPEVFVPLNGELKLECQAQFHLPIG